MDIRELEDLSLRFEYCIGNLYAIHDAIANSGNTADFYEQAVYFSCMSFTSLLGELQEFVDNGFKKGVKTE